mgnify:CR=1 FL=1
MRILPNKQFNRLLIGAIVAATILFAGSSMSLAASIAPVSDIGEDRTDIVSKQISLLKNRYTQAERELSSLQHNEAELSITSLEEASKHLLDKAALDIAVSQSNLESISIELADAKQTVSWLDKNIQEINNQLNVLKIFGESIAKSEPMNAERLHTDLDYQQKLITLEQERVQYLRDLQGDAGTILQIKQDQLAKLNALLKSQRLQRMKQQEVRDELAYQEQQNQWLLKLNGLYAKLQKINPVTHEDVYARVEDEIFSANEHANYAYAQSLIARYRDQIQQLSSVVLKSSSISQLNELGGQAQLLSKQMERLGVVLKARMKVLSGHAMMASQYKDKVNNTDRLNDDLKGLLGKYQKSSAGLVELNENLAEFRANQTKALQVELSSRQGFPSFDVKTLLDIGKEILLVPALAFQVMKNWVLISAQNMKSARALTWGFYVFAQLSLAIIFAYAYKLTQRLLTRPSSWREKINSKWLSLKWLDHHFVDLYLLSSVLGTMYVFSVPSNDYIFFAYLAAVWFVFKSIIVVARICLVESTSHTAGKDMRLYQRLKWVFVVGGMTTAAAVFIYQMPVIYELKALSDRLFLLFMMLVSLMLLRFWDVVPNLILSHMEKRHPYFEKTIRVLGVLVPLLLFGNSAIGLLGYVNLVMSVSWYEGIFLIVLVAYLVLRGLLTDSVEQLSQVVIKHSNNGWLLTEAFLKPLDRLLRIFLLLAAGALLFLLYGWDKQSPIVERLNGLLHYQMATILNTSITPVRVLCLIVVVSFFYWSAKWTREFVYRSLAGRNSDMGIRNSMAILSQYAVIVIGIFISLQVMGIDSRALGAVAAALAFGVGLGLRDLANNFFCGFLILLERPLRVGDIIAVNDIEGEVINIGSRAVTMMTWDHTALVVPNAEIFNKSFTNLTARDNVVRCILSINISRHDNPHCVKTIINQVISESNVVLAEPPPQILLREMNELLLNFEVRYHVNIRDGNSRTMITSSLLLSIWDAFEKNGIKPPYPKQEIYIRGQRAQQLSGERAMTASQLDELTN